MELRGNHLFVDEYRFWLMRYFGIPAIHFLTKNSKKSGLLVSVLRCDVGNIGDVYLQLNCVLSRLMDTRCLGIVSYSSDTGLPWRRCCKVILPKLDLKTLSMQLVFSDRSDGSQFCMESCHLSEKDFSFEYKCRFVGHVALCEMAERQNIRIIAIAALADVCYCDNLADALRAEPVAVRIDNPFVF